MGRIDEDSDKHFWHRYTDTYEAALARIGDVREVLEFGVFHGASIRWMRARFPKARIVGVDILPVQPDWPNGPEICYARLDQGRRQDVAALFDHLGRRFDLIIEDGSHIPQHQASCLVEGLAQVRPGGLFILEDIHTSHPMHPYLAGQKNLPADVPTALTVLLAIQHRKDLGTGMDAKTADRLSSPGFFTASEVTRLFEQIDALSLYRRTSLPLRCYGCGSSDFDYRGYRCRCGATLYDIADSMSFLIARR